MEQDQGRFEDVRARLEEIVDEVNAEDISLDDALKLYEEAVKLGLSACELSESDIFPQEEAAEAPEPDYEASDIVEASVIEHAGDAASVQFSDVTEVEDDGRTAYPR